MWISYCTEKDTDGTNMKLINMEHVVYVQVDSFGKGVGNLSEIYKERVLSLHMDEVVWCLHFESHEKAVQARTMIVEAIARRDGYLKLPSQGLIDCWARKF